MSYNLITEKMERPSREKTLEQRRILIENVKKLRWFKYSDKEVISFVWWRSKQIISAIARKWMLYPIGYEKALRYNNLFTEIITNYERNREVKNDN